MYFKISEIEKYLYKVLWNFRKKLNKRKIKIFIR